MTNLSLTDRSLLWQIRFIHTKDTLKIALIDAFFRREEGMEFLQVAIMVAIVIVIGATFKPLRDTMVNIFKNANTELSSY